ncbi:hypothetical protein HDU98_009439 [Podochytrium sp. JEL0797]|nr:hypothetical protein HDU98_009439 [Podochytrium sp. JEL0797]
MDPMIETPAVEALAAETTATKRPAQDDTAPAAVPDAKKAKTETPTLTVEHLLQLSGVPTDRSYLLETDVGISTFLNPLQSNGRLTAIIKHRFTDFLVNEVDLHGNVLHLTKEDCDAVKEEAKPFSIDDVAEPVWEELKSLFEEADQETAVATVKEMLVNPRKFKKNSAGNKRDGRNNRDASKKDGDRKGADKKDAEVKEGAEAPVEGAVAKEGTEAAEEAPKEVEVQEPEKNLELLTKAYPEKEARVAVYDFFRAHFFEKLATDSRNNQRICIRPFMNQDRQRSIPRPDFSATGPGEHLSFVLYKENKDTMDCLNRLSWATKTPAVAYTFAGTKDKRGVTVQRCSGHKIYQSKLEGAFIDPQVRIGNFKYVKERVNLGDLLGNQFVITLRDVALASSSETGETDIPTILETSLTSLASSGFINYYGMQRFGTRSISTHQVGLAMLAGAWSTAVDLVMMPKGDERQDFKDARALWMEKRDYKAALKVFPRSCTAERAILKSMVDSRSGEGYFKALNAIPRNLRLMYLHAVQSFIWNHAASERIRVYGTKIVKGDLVAKFNPLSARNKSKDDSTPAPDTEESEISAVQEHRQGRMIEVELMETDEQAATKSIEDLVLPLPGHAVQYPTNEIGEFYKTFMAKYSLDPHDMKRKTRETSLAGDYRRVLIQPKNVSWKSYRYDDPNYPLSMTDLDRINGVPEPVSIPDGKRLGVVVEFMLETSSYATMALREILRSDTSAGFQTTLSSVHTAETDKDRDAAKHETA